MTSLLQRRSGLAVLLPGSGTPGPLGPPRGVSTSGSESSATLTWEEPAASSETVTGYRVGRDGTDANGAGPWSTVVAAGVRSHAFLNLRPSTTYALTVAAVSANGDGPSVTRSVTTGTSALPGAPTSLASTATTSTATLSWQPPTSPGSSPVTGYRVARTGAPAVDVAATVTEHTFTGLAERSSYVLSVAAVNASGAGPAATRAVMTGGSGNDIDTAPANPTVVGALPAHMNVTWAPIFHDDFNGNSLDRSKWNTQEAYETAPGHTSWAAWCPEPPTARELEVRDGMVHLHVRRVPNGGTINGKRWTTTSLNTTRPTKAQPAKFLIPANSTTFTQGRLRFPSNRGSLHGFWLLGDSYTGDPTGVGGGPATDSSGKWHNGHPVGGEVDIVEFANEEVPHYAPYSTLWWARDVYTNPPGTAGNTISTSAAAGYAARPGIIDSWHTWGLYRSPTLMVVYIDGVELCRWEPGKRYEPWPNAGFSDPLPAVLFTFPQHLIVTILHGHPWPTKNGQMGDEKWQEGTISCEYVKVWAA